jgi:hypothetical protein
VVDVFMNETRRILVVWLVTCLLVGVLGCPARPLDSDAAVSLINVLVDPSAFKGDRVIVHGYARRSGGFVRLYLSEEDAFMNNDAASLVISEVASSGRFVLRDECLDGYAKVVGEVGEVEGLGILGVSTVESILGFDLSSRPAKLYPCWPLSD